MLENIVIPAFLVLLVSFGISVWAAWHHTEPRVEAHLFAGNTAIFAISSSIGAVVSMAISFTALLSAGFVFGWQVLVSMILGALTGLSALLAFLEKPSVMAHLPTSVTHHHPGGASYLRLFATGHDQSYLLYYIFFINAYVFMLITEIAVFRGVLLHLLRLPKPEIFALLAIMTFVCYAYVFVGGFRGVLITDYFQLLVILWFVAMLLPSAPTFTLSHLPPPTQAKIPNDVGTLALLHLGVFIGTFGWTLASVDQWYRTAGTLPRTLARRVLCFAVALVCMVIVLPVFVGSLAHQDPTIPPRVTNRISLLIVAKLLDRSNATLRFVFAMALACAVLTTMNTYIITIQQLYYEFSVRFRARTARFYIVEYLIRWRQVRTVGLLLVLASFISSFLIGDSAVYAVGVAALSSFVFAAPLLLLRVCEAPQGGGLAASLEADAPKALLLSLGLFPVALHLLRSAVGSLTLHLYLIPLAAGMAACVGFVPWAVRGPLKRGEGC